MSVRDSILPAMDQARQILDGLGFRRYQVTIRRRAWSGAEPGDGTYTTTDLALSPSPKVRQVTTKEVADSGGTWRQGDYRVDKITPSYSGLVSGGYTPEQLVLTPASNEDVVIELTGDEGTFECTLVEVHFEMKFTYWLVARRAIANR